MSATPRPFHAFRQWAGVALAALTAVAGAGEATAQTAEPDTTLETVVVTATRTAKALEDVAVPTTVISAETARADGDLRLAALGSRIQTLLSVTKLLDVFQTFETADDALASFA